MMAKCAMFNGKLGFYSEGGAELICSEDTCGSKGHAEFGCERCCSSTTTAPFISTRGHQMQADLSQTALSFLFVVVAVTSLVVVVSLLYFAFKRWKSWRLHLRCARQRDAENGENIEMIDVPPVEQERLNDHVHETEAETELRLVPSSSVSCIPTQDQVGQKEEKKNFQYVPGQPLFDQDSESEHGEEAL